MNRLTSYIGILLVMLLASCREAPINGDLDGQWQILTVEYADGSTSEPDGDLFYRFQQHICQLSRYGEYRYAYASMVYDDDTIELSFPYITDNNTDVRPWGISSAQTTFHIDHLSASRLVISSDFATVTMRKF